MRHPARFPFHHGSRPARPGVESRALVNQAYLSAGTVSAPKVEVQPAERPALQALTRAWITRRSAGSLNGASTAASGASWLPYILEPQAAHAEHGAPTGRAGTS